MAGGGGVSIEYTPTWVLALVCSIIVAISFAAERLLHYTGKVLRPPPNRWRWWWWPLPRRGKGTVAVIEGVARSSHIHLRPSFGARPFLCSNNSIWKLEGIIDNHSHVHPEIPPLLAHCSFVRRYGSGNTGELVVQPSDHHFWFSKPRIVLVLIHLILFQNSFEIAVFFWVLVLFSFNSCIMGQVGYIIPRLVIGVVVQLLCSYSTLPLYAIVAQMGSSFNKAIFEEHIQVKLTGWAQKAKMKRKAAGGGDGSSKVGNNESPSPLSSAPSSEQSKTTNGNTDTEIQTTGVSSSDPK